MKIRIHNKDTLTGMCFLHVPLSRSILRTNLITMKLTVLLLVFFSFHSLADVSAQEVTLDMKDVDIEKVIGSIRRQTGYNFVINSDVLKTVPKISITVKQQSLTETLHQLFTPIGLTYEIHDKSIVVKKSPPQANPTPARQERVRGRIADSLGVPLQGVSILEKQSGRQTTSDKDGRFELHGVSLGDLLVFRSVGYQLLELSVDRAEVFVILKPSLALLDEAEVRGYYATSKRFTTGNVSRVSAKEIAQYPLSDPIATLAGRITGLTVTQPNGVPGSGVNVQLRGRNSIANGNDPLFIINGVPFPSTSISSRNFGGGNGFLSPLNSLNLNDIESITVLKDADATAIYGSMGANGVILITTKSGTAGDTQVDANFYTGWGKVSGKLDLMNTEQYLQMRREAFRNDNLTPAANQYDVNGTWDESRYTDWQELFIGGTSNVNDGQLRISGGTARTQFSIGSGIRKENTVTPGNFYDQKYSIQSSINHQSTNNKFKASVSFNYANNENRTPEDNFMSFITLAPNAPDLYDQLGNLNWENETWTNPFAALNKRHRVVNNSYLTNGSLSYEIVDGLTLSSTFGINQIWVDQNLINPSSAMPPSQQGNSDFRRNTFMKNKLSTWIVEPQATFHKVMNKHRFDVLLGMTFRENVNDALTQRANTFSSDALINNIHAAGQVSVINYANSQYRYHALYTRIGYQFAERYILNLTGRRDGSSRFGPGKQFGNFAAIGAAWIISEEEFMKPLAPVLSFAKFRASFGITGNDQITDYQYLSTYAPIPGVNFVYLTNPAIIPTRLHNPDYGWESVRKLEAALDLGFLNEQVLVSASWYRNRTDNQLVGYPLPQVTGFNSIQMNMPAVIRNNGWEFEITTNFIGNRQLKWNASANISFPRNKLIEYPNFESSTYRQDYEVGSSMFGRFRYGYTGVDPETGLYTFVDRNSDGRYTAADDRHFVVTEDKFQGGISNNLSWKGFDFSFLFQFIKHTGDLFTQQSTAGMFNVNQPVNVLDRWQSAGNTGNNYQKYSTRSLTTIAFYNNSDGQVHDASFLRLKNVLLSWNLPKGYLPHKTFDRVRLYVQGQNLLTISGYNGLNPETPAGFIVLPPIRLVTTGIQVTL